MLRDSIPQLWQRHYSISSVGGARNEVLQNYVGNQVQHHPMADEYALSLMNNLAYAHGMKAVYERSFYVGTFGAYDDQAIRRGLVAGQ